MDILLSVDDGSVSELSLAALAHVRKEVLGLKEATQTDFRCLACVKHRSCSEGLCQVTKLFYGLDVKGDGLLRVKDFTRISEARFQGHLLG